MHIFLVHLCDLMGFLKLYSLISPFFSSNGLQEWVKGNAVLFYNIDIVSAIFKLSNTVIYLVSFKLSAAIFSANL